jgi:cell division protein FtsA
MKNMEPEIAVGLDIGTTKIACLVGKKNEYGKIEILGVGKSDSHGVMRGVVANIDQTVQAIHQAVKDAEEKSGVEIKDVNVGIAGQHIKSLQNKGMRIRKSLDEEISQRDIDEMLNDMKRMVMMPGEEIIHILPQEYIVDHEQFTKQPIGMSGIRLEANFHIITGSLSAATNLYKCISRAGLNTLELTLEPIASADAVLTEEEREAGVVLVDIGGGTTDVAIFQDGIIRHTAVIPFGGNIITEDIKEGCTIIKSQAEALKIKFGSALASENLDNEVVVIPGLKGREPKEISIKNLAHIIQARLEEIIEHVHFEIKKSGYERKLIAGIVLTGGGSNMKHIKQLFELMIGMDCRIGYPNEHLAKSAIDLSNPIYSTGIGLLMQGLKNFDKQKSKMMARTQQVSEQVKPVKTSFLDKIIAKSKELFEDDI